jgi:hypothetical protein
VSASSSTMDGAAGSDAAGVCSRLVGADGSAADCKRERISLYVATQTGAGRPSCKYWVAERCGFGGTPAVLRPLQCDGTGSVSSGGKSSGMRWRARRGSDWRRGGCGVSGIRGAVAARGGVRRAGGGGSGASEDELDNVGKGVSSAGSLSSGTGPGSGRVSPSCSSESSALSLLAGMLGFAAAGV